jgi:hypothetical protein
MLLCYNGLGLGRAVTQAVNRRLPTAGFEPRSDHVGFAMDEVALQLVFSENFGSFLFGQLLHIH